MPCTADSHPYVVINEDFVMSEDGILNIKTSLRLSKNSSEKWQTGKLIYLFHTLWLALS